MSAAVDVHALARQYSDPLWRLNNLYWIQDKAGRKVLFRMNDAQERLYWELWWRTVILKARQRGFSTLLLLMALDRALFNDNYQAGVIAHTLPDAKRLLESKILYPYEHLPEGIKVMRPAVRDRADSIKFNNYSSVTVSTSFRSGTLQWLHVSELGKIAAKHPEKAEEIKTGAMEAVSDNGMVVVESTAEGRAGFFYDLCQEAEKAKDEGRKLTKLDFKFYFEPWWTAEEYRVTPDGFGFSERLVKYFEELETKHGIVLDEAQKTWYAIKERTLKDKMLREYPSTPEEAFQAAVEGAYFAEELKAVRRAGRITEVPVLPDVPVEAWWDIGHDTTAIWFTQTVGMWCHVIGYYQNAQKKLIHYRDKIEEFREAWGFRRITHHWPHDMGNEIDWSMDQHKTRADKARELGMVGEVHPRMESKEDGIEAARNFFGYCVFDKNRCDEGLKGLESYRQEWDEKRGDWKGRPLHDWASHPADAFQQLALYHQFPAERSRRVVKASKQIKQHRFGT